VVRKIVVRKNRYFDSVFLMQVAQRIASEPGIRDASALLGTDANRKVLADMGYGDAGRDTEFAHAGPNDLIIALEGEESAVTAVAADPESRLQRPVSAGTEAAPEPRSIAEAAARMTNGGVAVISVPGAHAARIARRPG
jgi:FdrA protein